MIYAEPAALPFARFCGGYLLRYVVLFIPGYMATEAMFPRLELDSIEHFALSIGLSIAVSTLVVFFLNYTPWGIRLLPIVVPLTMFTVALGTIGFFREYAND